MKSEVYGVMFQLDSMDEPRLLNFGRQLPNYGTSKRVAKEIAEKKSTRWVVRLIPDTQDEE